MPNQQFQQFDRQNPGIPPINPNTNNVTQPNNFLQSTVSFFKSAGNPTVCFFTFAFKI